jgi:2-keto-4-pentenoate hydratase/2-oxohepta-3-ene-1,7-dioic acid hydratase in catechol pathway
LVYDDKVVALSALEQVAERAAMPLTGTATMLAFLQSWERNIAGLACALDGANANDLPFTDLDRLTVHAPLVPPAIYAAGANYKRHVAEIIADRFPDPALSPAENHAAAVQRVEERSLHGTPYVFQKSPAAISGPFDPVVLPPDTQQADWEVELAVVIGKHARYIEREAALDVVAGYAIANDVSERSLTFRADEKALGADWLASKSSPTFLPFGPYIVPRAFVPDPHVLAIRLDLNGDVMQNADTSDMIFDLPALIAYLSRRVALRPGDVILSGSPHGNGTHYNRYLAPGDVMVASIAGLGYQRTPCIAEIQRLPKAPLENAHG